MNSLEFKTVLDVLGINNPIGNRQGRYGKDETMHAWNDLTLAFGGSFYAVVNGNVPFEVAKDIWDKYPNDPYGIRAGGYSLNPYECADHPEIHALMKKYHSGEMKIKDVSKLIKDKRKELEKTESKNLSVYGYHIDTKEGLVILLTSIKDNIAKQQANGKKLGKLEMSRYTKIMGEINRRLVKQTNLGITTDEWLKSNGTSRVALADTADKQLLEIRELIGQLEIAVNPFASKGKLKESETKNMIGVWGDEKDNVIMDITGEQTKVKYYREQAPNKKNEQKWIGHSVHYNHEKVEGAHSQPNTSLVHRVFPEENEEWVFAVKNGADYSGSQLDLRVELGSGMAETGKTYHNLGSPVTTEQKAILIKELKEAIEKANSVTSGIAKTKENSNYGKRI